MTGLTSERHRFSDLDEAQEYYHLQGMTDGLPVVLPTEERVQAMLEYAGLQPSDVIAKEDVRGKVFTAEKVAVNAVMAGCKPEYMPVVVAAVEAVADKAFSLHTNSTSTNGVGILALVSGPIARKLGINSGTGAMGHGFRANATIGRALGLIKINVYGSVPHEMDKSTLGHPGKYTFCFAEDDELIPWEPLRVERGFSRESSAVTVFATIAPLQISTFNYTRPEEFLTTIADAVLGVGSRHEELIVVMAPEVLEYVRRSGWAKRQIKDFIFEKAQRTGKEWNAWYRHERPFAGPNLEKRHPVVNSAEHITLVGAGGGAGPLVAIIGSWGGSSSITKEIK